MASSASASQSPEPLDLRLPSGPSTAWKSRSPALGDPRADTARSTFESRLSAALGGEGIWVEERDGPDRVRFRRGDTCVDMERSRNDGIDPYNRSAGSRPWVAGRPQKC
ncbi:MAG: hypothetical protein ABIN96_14900 [Rubrivivax sp.]